MQIIKKILITILCLTLLLGGVIWLCSYLIVSYAEDRTYSSIYDIPHNRVGVILGTSKSLRTGAPNPYFIYRIEAAAALYHVGKIDKLVISGDNSDKYYNEPRDMKKALMAKGISEDNLFIDAAGLRTLDSMVRMKEIFQQTTFTVISQKFHNERAIYLGRAFSLDVIGFNAEDVGVVRGFKVQTREKLARVKVFLDIMFNKQPRFLGEPIPID